MANSRAFILSCHSGYTFCRGSAGRCCAIFACFARHNSMLPVKHIIVTVTKANPGSLLAIRLSLNPATIFAWCSALRCMYHLPSPGVDSISWWNFNAVFYCLFLLPLENGCFWLLHDFNDLIFVVRLFQ